MEYKIIKYFSLYTNFAKSFFGRSESPTSQFAHPNTGQSVELNSVNLRLTGLDWIFGMRIWIY